jgi:hypothetical protein
MFLRWGVVSTSLNPKAGGPHLFGCPRLFIQYIRSYPPYWRPFLHPQPEDAPCRGDRDPLITVISVTISYTVYFTFIIFENNTKLYICTIIIVVIALTRQNIGLLLLAAISLLSNMLPTRMDVTASTSIQQHVKAVVTFEAAMLMAINTAVFWDVVLSDIVRIHQSIWCYIPECRNLQSVGP